MPSALGRDEEGSPSLPAAEPVHWPQCHTVPKAIWSPQTPRGRSRSPAMACAIPHGQKGSMLGCPRDLATEAQHIQFSSQANLRSIPTTSHSSHLGLCTGCSLTWTSPSHQSPNCWTGSPTEHTPSSPHPHIVRPVFLGPSSACPRLQALER